MSAKATTPNPQRDPLNATRTLLDEGAAIIRQHARPLMPISTDTVPQCTPLAGIRAVIFDIYGTLVISASGDISLAENRKNDDSLRDALAAAGIKAVPVDLDLAAHFETTIHEARAVRSAAGIAYPEIDIRNIWHTFLERLQGKGARFAMPDAHTRELLAIDYECRVNPVWPMPHLAEMLQWLREAGFILGIVSNAQFYTHALFPAFLNKGWDDLGFAEDCCLFSYFAGEGKPSVQLFEQLTARLAARGIQPAEALYVGNDLRNDIWPAAKVGLRTVLFAGDARSLRWRAGDPEVKDTQPDRIITELVQLRQIIGEMPIAGVD